MNEYVFDYHITDIDIRRIVKIYIQEKQEPVISLQVINTMPDNNLASSGGGGGDWLHLTLNVRVPSYPGLTRSISWLLMLWLLASYHSLTRSIFNSMVADALAPCVARSSAISNNDIEYVN